MYVKYSEALAMMVRQNKTVLRKLEKKRDIETVTDMCRIWSTASREEAGAEVIRMVNPELADELLRHSRGLENAKTLKDYSSIFKAVQTLEVSSFYRWMKSQGLYGETFAKATNVLMEYEPVLYTRWKLTLNDRKLFNMLGNCVVTRSQWLQAIKLSSLRYDSQGIFTSFMPYRKIDGDCLLFYCDVLTNLYHLLKYEQGIVAPVKKHHNDNNEVYLERISALTSQLDSLREENEALARRDRKELNAVVVPLEQNIREQAARIEELLNENTLLREIQEDLAEQSSISEDLLDLPRSGVLFVGGSPQLREKVRAAYPEWKLVSPEEMSKLSGMPEVVFVYYNYISHKSFNQVRKNLTKKPLYCSGTNWERLEHSMRAAYTMQSSK